MATKPLKDFIEKFFRRYPAFKYDRTKPSSDQFKQLCDKYGWKKDETGRRPKEWIDAEAEYRIAATESFHSIFGKDFDDNDAWGKLCSQLGVNPLPDSIEERRKIVTGKHVNLMDLVDSRRTGLPLRMFETESELREYTIIRERYFPKEKAYAGSLLRWLLREIHNKYLGSRGKEHCRGRKRKGRK